MIRAAAWFCADHCGTVVAGARSWRRTSPAKASSEEMLAFIGRPVKYFPRMTPESRSCLGAASIALQACGWTQTDAQEIGLVAAGYEGCLAADQNYFGDYVSSGRSLGRGNLFIYTLPTSTMGEVAIALGLRGPTLHLHDADHPVNELLRCAQGLVDDCEADAILALWSDPQAAVCVAIDGADGVSPLEAFDWGQTPQAVAQCLAGMV